MDGIAGLKAPLRGDTPDPGTPHPGARLAEGPVARGLAIATAPLAAALLVIFGLQLAETWLTGLLGPASLAAMGFAAPVAMAAMSFGIGLGAGASAVVARALGAGEAMVARFATDALWLAGGVALVVAVPGWLAAPWLLRALGAEGEVHALALGYLRAWLPGAVPLLVGMVALSIIRAAGDTRFQGAALAGAGALAFALDWPLAFGVPKGPWGVLPGLGVTGLGIAAGLAWAAMLALALRHLRRIGLLDGAPPARATFGVSARRVLRVGLPAAGANAIIPVATGLFTAMIAAEGAAAVAGFGIGSRAEALAMTAFFALSAVANPFAAQNAGAGRLDRVRAGMRAAMVFCATFGLALGVVFWLAGPSLAAAFTDDAAVAASTARYFAILPWGFGAVGAIAVAAAAFNGLERPLAGVAVSLARTLTLGVPAAWLGGQLGGETGLLCGILAANIMVGTAAALWVLRATAPR